MAIFGGALADRIGFRRSLSAAYFILTLAYFLVGSIGAPWLAPVRQVDSARSSCGIVPLSGAGSGVGKALGRRHDCTSVERKRSVYRLRHLLHHGQHRETAGPFLAGWITLAIRPSPSLCLPR